MGFGPPKPVSFRAMPITMRSVTMWLSIRVFTRPV